MRNWQDINENDYVTLEEFAARYPHVLTDPEKDNPYYNASMYYADFRNDYNRSEPKDNLFNLVM